VRRLGSIPVEGKTPEGDIFKGKILQVSAEPDYDTGLFTIDMEFPRIGNLNSGKVLFVDLPASEPKGIMVEEASIFLEESTFFLWVVNDKNLISKREITPGEKIESQVIIDGGVVAGDRYLREVTGKEKEGMSIPDLMNLVRDSD
jgi:multidrug efflux pump subunit AcrA (membrane-fusion protein)